MSPTEFRAARDQLGYTQAQLAKQLGVSVRTISRYECASRDVPGPIALAAELLLQASPASNRPA